jgi:hypothetical protein
MTIIAIGQVNVPVVLDISIVDTSTNTPSDALISLFLAGSQNVISPSVSGPSYAQYVLHPTSASTIYDLHITSNAIGPGPVNAQLRVLQNNQSLALFDEYGNPTNSPAVVNGLPTGQDTLTLVSVTLR